MKLFFELLFLKWHCARDILINIKAKNPVILNRVYLYC